MCTRAQDRHWRRERTGTTVDHKTALRTRPAASAQLQEQADVAPLPRRRRAGVRRDGYGALFVSPFVIALTLFMIVPIGYAVYDSLYTTKLIGGTSFAGFDNYRQVLTS